MDPQVPCWIGGAAGGHRQPYGFGVALGLALTEGAGV
jgi:hypothetical protein